MCEHSLSRALRKVTIYVRTPAPLLQTRFCCSFRRRRSTFEAEHVIVLMFSHSSDFVEFCHQSHIPKKKVLPTYNLLVLFLSRSDLLNILNILIILEPFAILRTVKRESPLTANSVSAPSTLKSASCLHMKPPPNLPRSHLRLSRASMYIRHQ